MQMCRCANVQVLRTYSFSLEYIRAPIGALFIMRVFQFAHLHICSFAHLKPYFCRNQGL